MRIKLSGLVAFGVALALPLAAWAQFGFPGPPDVIAAPSGSSLMGGRLFQLILVGGTGYLIGAFLSPMAKPLRQVLFLGLAAVLILFSLFGPYPSADGVGLLVKFFAFFAALAFGLTLGKVAGKRRRRRPTSYGSAKWATYDYLNDNRLFGQSGFLLGGFFEKDRAAPLRYDGARHLLTVAPTRSGKGVSSIIPNLLLHQGSALVIDPKGENALITAPRRGAGDARRGIAGMGQEVVLLDPWNVAAETLGCSPGHFNPLDWISAGNIADDEKPGWDPYAAALEVDLDSEAFDVDPDAEESEVDAAALGPDLDPDAVENAFLLADALVVKEGGSGDSAFWDEEAKALLTGIILYVATAREEAGKRHLGRVRDILTQDETSLQETLMLMLTHRSPVVRSTAARTISKESKLRSSVLASAQAHTHFLESPRIRDSLSKSDFKFEDLKSKKLTVYLILPADRLVTFNRWLRLLIQQAITVNARNIAVTPDKPILFMLDEMPTLGKLPSIEQAYGLMAGFGMQLWGIVQDLSQLAKTYGEHGWQTFISNCGVIQYMGSRDKMTAEYFSALCGVTTIEVHNFSWAVGQAISFASGSSSSGGSGGFSVGSSSTSTTSSNWSRTNGVSEAQRHLAYPDELMVLKNNEQLIFVESLDPIAAQKVVWYKDQTLRTLGVNLQSDVTPPARLLSADQRHFKATDTQAVPFTA